MDGLPRGALRVLNVPRSVRFSDELSDVDELLMSGSCAAGDVLDERELVR